MTWYYALGNERQGPVDDAALDRLIATGAVTQETLVWKAGMADWQPLAQARPRAAAPPAPVIPPPPGRDHAGAGGDDAASAAAPGTRSRGSDAEHRVRDADARRRSAGGAWRRRQRLRRRGYGAGRLERHPGLLGRCRRRRSDLRPRRQRAPEALAIGDIIGRAWQLVIRTTSVSPSAGRRSSSCPNILGAIPSLGILITLAVTPILQAGVYRLMLGAVHRDEPAEFTDVFSTFSTWFLQLFLLHALVQFILDLRLPPCPATC